MFQSRGDTTLKDFGGPLWASVLMCKMGAKGQWLSSESKLKSRINDQSEGANQQEWAQVCHQGEVPLSWGIQCVHLCWGVYRNSCEVLGYMSYFVFIFLDRVLICRG